MTGHPRGYTLTELAVAAALTLSVGLGGLLAVQMSTRASRIAAAAQEAMAAAVASDKAIERGAMACELTPGKLLDPNDGDARACRTWMTLITAEVAHQRNGTLPGGTRWFMRLDRNGFARGLVLVDTRYVREGEEVLHHVQLVPEL